MKKLKTVLFDFDGVLSKGRFYATISEAHPEIHSRIIECVFSKDSGDIVRSWMRGEMSFEELHANFADQAGALPLNS